MLARTLPVRGARGKQVVVVYIGFGAPLVLFWFILLKEEVRTYLLDFYVSPGLSWCTTGIVLVYIAERGGAHVSPGFLRVSWILASPIYYVCRRFLLFVTQIRGHGKSSVLSSFVGSFGLHDIASMITLAHTYEPRRVLWPYEVRAANVRHRSN